MRDDFDISDDVWEQEVKAVKVFTDREDPQEAFERKFRVLSNNWKKTFYVLNYYGIGGVGKTSFVNKLCRVIKGVEGNDCRLPYKIDCDYIRYDFSEKNASIDKLSILLNWRNQLAAVDEKFGFYMFDSAVLLYSKKTGNNIEKDEVATGILDRNPWLNAVVTAVGAIPIVGWVSSAIQAIDKATGATKELVKEHIDKEKYKKHLEEINSLEPPEILDKLHEYFIRDMRNNMQRIAKRPLVVFIDTYEKYIDNVNRDKDMITEDYWLRKGRRSVIQSIPGVLWVVTGREKLYWAEDDDRWGAIYVERPLDQMTEAEKEALAEEHLEQHLLGDLSLKDATYFLEQAGVKDTELCEQLYKLTSGTPLFLDICVDTYEELRMQGITPNIKHFGKDLTQLISRYLSNLDKDKKEMAYFLACLGTWTNDSVREISGHMTTLKDYTYSRYEEFVKHSFIIRNPNNSYYMHETVRAAAIKNADVEIVEEVAEVRLDVLGTAINKETTLQSNMLLSEYVNILTENSYAHKEFCDYLENVKEGFRSLKRNGAYDLLYSISLQLFKYTKDKYQSTVAEMIARSEYGESLRLKGKYKEALDVITPVPEDKGDLDIDMSDWLDIQEKLSNVYYSSGNYEKSLRLDEQLYAARKQLLGAEHPDTLNSLHGVAIGYNVMGNYKKAKELHEQVLDARRRVLGTEHPSTLSTMGNLANACDNLGEYEKARQLQEQVLEISRRVLGAEHPHTLVTLNNIASSYDNAGEYEKAKQLKEEVLEVRRRVLGAEHPHTLITMNNLANSYNYLGDYEKAKQLREEVLEVRRRVLGEEHPNTLTTMANLANSYCMMGEQEKAKQLREYVLEVRKRVLGEEHPDTINAMRNLAISYKALKEDDKAKELEERISAIIQ